MNGSARSIRNDIEGGMRSSVAIVQEHVDRAETLQRITNAFTEIDRAGAMVRAAEIDAELIRGELTGVPIALKDLIDHVGHVTTAGSDFYRHQPAESAPVVDRLESAGAVIIGRTGLHEFAYGFSSENAWFGPVRNPWDPSLSPGGSSGGSAAAVSAGAVPIALGTDTGGSVRVPAALCGVFGLKVTHGRVPISGVLPLAASLDTVGPLARTIDDLAIAYEVIRGFEASDPWSVDIEDDDRPATPLEGLRVGIPTQWLASVPTSHETQTSFDTFVKALNDAGATCAPLDVDRLVPDPRLVTVAAAEAAGVHRRWFTDIDKQYGSDVEERLAAAMEITVDQLTDAKQWQAGLVQAARSAFAACDVILTPTVGPRPQGNRQRHHRP